jgi:hypothetical protein
MDRSDDVNNCRSEATLVFAMMPDFIHIGQVGGGANIARVSAPTIVVPL